MCEYTQRRFCTVKGDDDDDDEHGVYKIGRGQEKKNASSLLWIIIVTQAFAGTALSLDIAIVLEWTEYEMHQLVECWHNLQGENKTTWKVSLLCFSLATKLITKSK